MKICAIFSFNSSVSWQLIHCMYIVLSCLVVKCQTGWLHVLHKKSVTMKVIFSLNLTRRLIICNT